MSRTRLLISAAALGGLLALAGCSSNGAAPAPPSSSSSAPGGTGVLSTVPPPPATEAPDAGVEYRVTYPFGIPSSTQTVENPASQRVYLVGVYAGDHPEGNPAYQRISFYFRGGFPSYRFGYVPAITEDATGDPVALDGGYFLSVVFNGAQAHDETTGLSTVAQTPSRPVGLSALLDYADAGDFEGYVSYGLGVAEAGDTAPEIRSGELKRPDGAGDFFYVVHFDVRA